MGFSPRARRLKPAARERMCLSFDSGQPPADPYEYIEESGLILLEELVNGLVKPVVEGFVGFFL